MKTKFSLWSLVVVLILSVFLFTGCDELLNPPKKVTSVTITQNDQAIILGNTLQLTATVAPSDATNKDVIWSSSDTSVATVSASGLVSTVATGSATITATTEDQNKTDTVIITVNPVPIAVTGVTIDQNDQAIFVGSTLQLSATIAPSNATNTNVTWSSSNTSAATVSTTGLVSAVAAGSATITVTTEDQSKTDTVVITVNPV
ncbi:MAG: Ig-like domain-containing protein, partial [Sphaerochaeta sp.]|nr:Ig-like domain-containing protein [Sphaerochaeta sp.]